MSELCEHQAVFWDIIPGCDILRHDGTKVNRDVWSRIPQVLKATGVIPYSTEAWPYETGYDFIDVHYCPQCGVRMEWVTK